MDYTAILCVPFSYLVSYMYMYIGINSIDDFTILIAIIIFVHMWYGHVDNVSPNTYI